MRQVFKKFGPLLKDPNTDKTLHVPKNLPVIHKYSASEDAPDIDAVINESWHTRLTKGNLFKACVICGSSNNVQMHHLRQVKDVKAKIANQKSKFKTWEGAFLRKQIPLCQYHHALYHNGSLLHYELNLISKYSHNMSNDLGRADED